MANITLYELSQYNNGILRPFVIGLDRISSREEYLEAIQEELNSMIDMDEDSDGNRPLYEEWIVAGFYDVPHSYVGEYDLRDDYWEYKAAREAAPWLEEDVFAAGAELDIPPASISDAYQGYFQSDEDFAAELAESMGLLDGMPENLRYYFDYEKFARDLMISDYMEENGYYFSRNY